MFSRGLKIKKIAATAENGFIFLFGLGSDGQAYIWNSVDCAWRLHKTSPQPPEETK